MEHAEERINLNLSENVTDPVVEYQPSQNADFTDNDALEKYGSFQDSLRAPVHRWFTYPAGYSYKLVESKIAEYGLGNRQWILDPFVGTGTTSVAAKAVGVNSIGVEAHPFVYWVAKTKLHSNYDLPTLQYDANSIQDRARVICATGIEYDGVWPALVYKCFTDENLQQLLALRTAIVQHETSPDHTDLLKVALTATLRDVTSAGAGWPYIAPSKYAKRTVQREAIVGFRKRISMMITDVFESSVSHPQGSLHKLFNGDARNLEQYAAQNGVDMVLTSPPYLNNYDYADRTRLETYFWGIYESWGDITRKVRDHLIVAATTQIRRSAMEQVRSCPNIKGVSGEIHAEISKAVYQLGELRLEKAGKKSYDLMVAGYFEDMLRVIQGVYRLLRTGQPFILVLGDSAPYGIHIRTDEIIAELALAVGFSTCHIQVIRARGGKWAGNSQRHKVPLRESIVTITK